MAQLYTPFLSKIGENLGRGMEKRAIGELIQKATMGDPEALSRLTRVDPNSASKIRKDRVDAEQRKLNNDNQQRTLDIQENRYNQANDRVTATKENRTKKIVRDNQKYIENTLENAGKYKTFEEAEQYSNGRRERNAALAGNDDFKLTKEVYDSYRKLNESESKSKNDIRIKEGKDGFYHRIDNQGFDLGRVTNQETLKDLGLWKASKEEKVEDRSKRKEDRQERKFTFNKDKTEVEQTTDVRVEYNKDASELKETKRLINVGITALKAGGPISDKIVQSVLSRLSSSKVRALAELEQFKNYGTLAQRAGGALSQFVSGDRSDKQKEIALNLMTNFMDTMVTPGLQSTKNYYREIAKSGNLNLHNAVRFSDRYDVRSALSKKLISRERAKEIIQMIEAK